MKIDLESVDLTQFYVNEHILNGELVYLIIPQSISAKWNENNKVLRSSVWDMDGELISAGFPKFTNWGENPEVFPLPTSLKDAVITEKIDGSLLIVSKWKGQYILRTRGTIDATKLDNGHELEIFEEKILSKIIGTAHDLLCGDIWNFSLLFEWVSPNQKIVLNYGDEPDWYLVGYVDHFGYQLLEQYGLDSMATDFGWKRPTHYKFPTIEELLANVEVWQGKEGVCIYSNHGQSIHKCKSNWYLSLHRMKSELSSFEKVLDVYFIIGRPSYNDFCKYLETKFDYELMTQCIPFMSKICEAAKEVNKIVDGMNNFIAAKLKLLPSRKEQALIILQAYGNTNRANFLFSLLDGKQLTDDQLKKLYFQVVK